MPSFFTPAAVMKAQIEKENMDAIANEAKTAAGNIKKRKNKRITDVNAPFYAFDNYMKQAKLATQQMDAAAAQKKTSVMSQKKVPVVEIEVFEHKNAEDVCPIHGTKLCG